MDAARTLGERARGPRRPDRRRSAPEPSVAPARSAPRTRVIDLRGRTVTPGLPGCPRPSGARRAGPMLRCDLTRTRRPDRLPGDDRGLRRAPTGRGVDPRRRLVHGRLPRRHAPTRGPRRDRARTGRSSSRTATATAPGSTVAHWSWPASPATRGPRRRPDRARRRRRADRRAPRGRRWTSSRACCRTTRPAELRRALRLGQAISTRSGSRPGRTRSSRRESRSGLRRRSRRAAS